MNPFLLLGIVAVVAGLIIEQVQKKKQAQDDPPVEPVVVPPVEVAPDEPEAIPDSSSSGVDDSPDSGDIPTPAVPGNSGDRGINLDT